jgi:hypothetical protein
MSAAKKKIKREVDAAAPLIESPKTSAALASATYTSLVKRGRPKGRKDSYKRVRRTAVQVADARVELQRKKVAQGKADAVKPNKAAKTSAAKTAAAKAPRKATPKSVPATEQAT